MFVLWYACEASLLSRMSGRPNLDHQAWWQVLYLILLAPEYFLYRNKQLLFMGIGHSQVALIQNLYLSIHFEMRIFL